VNAIRDGGAGGRPRIPALGRGGARGAVAGGLRRFHTPRKGPIPAYKPPKTEPASMSSADSPPQTPWLEDGHPLAHDRVLAEISHELGNLFHKLYYWAEFLQERRGGQASDAAPAPQTPPTAGRPARVVHGL